MKKQHKKDDLPILIKPHRWFYNPGKYILDNIMSIGAMILGPLDKIVSFSTSSKSIETLQYLEKQRKKTANRWKRMIWYQDYMWSRMFPNGGVKNVWTCVPRNENILYEWNIVEKHFDITGSGNGDSEEKKKDLKSDNFVNVLFQCPSALIPETSMDKLERIDLKKIDPSVPILFFFYGGAMVLKGSRGDAPGFARELVNMQNKHEKTHGTKSATSKNIITVVIDYRVAPDDPFPAAIIDTLSTVEYVLENSKSPVHIIGQSAGGNLAAVMAMEAHRKYPGRVKSAFLWDPMLNPKADTMSYYMNSLSSGLAPVYFLRWSWRAYLKLDEDQKGRNASENEMGDKKENSDNLDSVLGKESNRDLVRNSRWLKSKGMWRLCDPGSDLPSGLDSKSAPRFLITSAMGDPLHDDGLDFSNKLKEQGANVSYIPCRGSHILAFLLDTGKKKQICDKLREAVFDV